MSRARASTRVLDVLLALPVAPGVVTHEYAHVAGCLLAGVEVRAVRPLALLAGESEVVHERVESFPADLLVGLAPLPVNTALAALSFAIAAGLSSVAALAVTWLGVTFGLTAFPTRYDTDSLLRTADAAEGAARVAALAVAVPVRALTGIPYVGGVYGFLWTVALYGTLV
jgi:hypothetical protein